MKQPFLVNPSSAARAESEIKQHLLNPISASTHLVGAASPQAAPCVRLRVLSHPGVPRIYWCFFSPSSSSPLNSSIVSFSTNPGMMNAFVVHCASSISLLSWIPQLQHRLTCSSQLRSLASELAKSHSPALLPAPSFDSPASNRRSAPLHPQERECELSAESRARSACGRCVRLQSTPAAELRSGWVVFGDVLCQTCSVRMSYSAVLKGSSCP